MEGIATWALLQFSPFLLIQAWACVGSCPDCVASRLADFARPLRLSKRMFPIMWLGDVSDIERHAAALADRGDASLHQPQPCVVDAMRPTTRKPIEGMCKPEAASAHVVAHRAPLRPQRRLRQPLAKALRL